MIEQRVPFKEYPQYEVSSFGYLVRVLPARGTRVGTIVRGARRADGYLQVFRMPPFNLMHQIIAHVFLGPCPVGKEPNYCDRNRANNRLDNLEYLTRGENVAHGYAALDERQRALREATSRSNLSKRRRQGTYVRTEAHRVRARELAALNFNQRQT